LTPAVEENLAELLKTMEKFGYGLSRKEVLTLVGDYLNTNNMLNPFNNGYPKEDWWFGFSFRHKLSLKKTEIVEYARKKACDPFIIYGYFDLLLNTLNELKLLDKPERIWNLDETSFCLDASKTRVVSAKNVACNSCNTGLW